MPPNEFILEGGDREYIQRAESNIVNSFIPSASDTRAKCTSWKRWARPTLKAEKKEKEKKKEKEEKDKEKKKKKKKEEKEKEENKEQKKQKEKRHFPINSVAILEFSCFYLLCSNSQP